MKSAFRKEPSTHKSLRVSSFLPPKVPTKPAAPIILPPASESVAISTAFRVIAGGPAPPPLLAGQVGLKLYELSVSGKLSAKLIAERAKAPDTLKKSYDEGVRTGRWALLLGKA